MNVERLALEIADHEPTPAEARELVARCWPPIRPVARTVREQQLLHYLRFCWRERVPPVPARLQTVTLWLRATGARAPARVEQELRLLRILHQQFDYADPTDAARRLHRVTYALRRHP